MRPVCNRRTDRGIFILGKCLPFCARCIGIHVGIFMYLSSYFLFNVEIRTSLALLMLIPTIYDGGMQYLYGRESNNVRRLVTGCLAGAGSAAIDILAIKIVLRI